MGKKLNYRANLHRRALSRVVLRWQEAAELSGGELADRAGWSGAKMSLLLNAHQAMSEADFLTLAMILKADPVLRDRGLTSVRAALGQADAGQNGLGWTLAELEAEAQTLRIYVSDTVPPLLRTTAYDDFIWSSPPVAVQTCHKRYDKDQRQATLDMLAERLHRQVQVVFAETVLRHLAALQDIGADQLAWLVKLGELDNVTLQVVRDEDRTAFGGSFTILSFLEDRFEDVVHVEQLHGVEWLEGAEDRVVYRTVFDRLAFAALAVDNATEMIASFV
ncbi:DUF5753 domain-containing protein [Lentzea chajnantorensis]